jgi:hypothetical protein
MIDQIMWRNTKMKKGLLLTAILILITACGPSATTQPVLDDEFVTHAIENGIEVTFDGAKCTNYSQVVLPEGRYTIAFIDEVRKGTADLHVSQLVDGHTYQELVELQGGDPTKWNVDESYLKLANQIDTDYDIAEGIKRVTFALDEGEYAVFILNVKPLEVVTEQIFCFPITIIEDPSK